MVPSQSASTAADGRVTPVPAPPLQRWPRRTPPRMACFALDRPKLAFHLTVPHIPCTNSSAPPRQLSEVAGQAGFSCLLRPAAAASATGALAANGCRQRPWTSVAAGACRDTCSDFRGLTGESAGSYHDEERKRS